MKLFNKKNIILLCSLLTLIIVSMSCFLVPMNVHAQGSKADDLQDILQEGLLSEAQMDKSLRMFLGVNDEFLNGNLGYRMVFTESERQAAEHIMTLAQAYNENEKVYEIEMQEFEFTSTSGSKLKSQNIIVRKSSGGKNAKQVILGANYDNYGEGEEEGVGALTNGTGCAILLSLMEFYKDKALDFDLVFAFFGAGTYNTAWAVCSGAAPYSGSKYYADNTMTAQERKDTLLMINFSRLGGEKVYLYSDEVARLHNDFLMNKANTLDLDFNAIPKTLPIIEIGFIEKLPYSHWALFNDHAHFMQLDIPVANIFAADYNYFHLSDSELAGGIMLSYTKNDTYTKLKEKYPHFTKQMQSAAILTVKALNDEQFQSVMEQTRQIDYSWATQKQIALFVLAGIIIVLIAIVFYLSRRYEKKYPTQAVKPLKLKVAVFGMDYEEKKEDEIYIDLLKKNNDPFS